jgi:hypothetical protein
MPVQIEEKLEKAQQHKPYVIKLANPSPKDMLL